MTTRRNFLKRAAAAGAVFSVPIILPSRIARGADASKPSLAAIGVGGPRGRYSQGSYIARQARKLATTIAVCDVDDQHTAKFHDNFKEKTGRGLKMYGDYRELLEKERPDVVTIGTPDHWHVPISIAALRSGCDVYCEKPLTLTIEEGFEIRKVVKETGKVFQVGTQQRSQRNGFFLRAAAMALSGRLGDNLNAYLAIGGGPAEEPFETAATPNDLDWNLWLGPAPKVDYCPERQKMFRWFFEYSGGKMTDWGAHHVDIAQMALGASDTGPIRVKAKGSFPPLVPDNFDWDALLEGKETLPNGYNTATGFSIDLEFANGTVMNVSHHYTRQGDNINFNNGILLEGDKGRIFVNRGKLVGGPMEDLTEADHSALNELIVKLSKGKQPTSHMENFFNCIEDRSEPMSDVYSHHRTMTSCHLCNIALMLGRELTWDPQKETFPDDEQAISLMSRASREV